MLTTDENGVPKAEMPQRWDQKHANGMLAPVPDGFWVRAKDMEELVAQFNLLAQMVSIMVPKGR